MRTRFAMAAGRCMRHAAWGAWCLQPCQLPLLLASELVMPPHAFRRGVRNATQPLVGWVTAEASRLYRRTTAPPSMAKLAADGGAPAGVTHVLFDMDGLLLDTEKFYTVVQQRILAEHGKTFTWDLKAKMMGKKALEAGRILVEETGLEGVLSPEDFISQREQALHAMFPSSQLMPGAERLIRHLHSHGVPMAIATSSHKSHFDLKTTLHRELVALMHHVVVGDDPEVTLGKPAPDIFLTAAKRFQDPPSKLHRVLVFEDAPTGVAAALSAGMKVIMVPDPNLDKSLCRGADQVLTSLLEFEPVDWGLPPFV